MSVRTRVGAVAVAGAACTALAVVAPAGVASAAPSAGSPPTVTVTMSKSSIKFGKNNQISAGTTLFKIVSAGGQHDLQLVQLHKGYSLQQAGSDIPKAFNGNVPAINRIDNNMTFLGGAGASSGHPGYLVQTLPAGTYYAFDTDGNAVVKLSVTGKGATIPVPHQSVVTAFTYGFSQTPYALPSAGRMLFKNQADQPHFLVIQAVKQSTTNADVQKFINSGGQGNPPWALRFSTSTGAISPGVGMTWNYSVPKGKYLLACFWPDDKTGMPHFFMGMWKLVQFK
jgi:hypothetical protein